MTDSASMGFPEAARWVSGLLQNYLDECARGNGKVITLAGVAELRKALRPERWLQGGAGSAEFDEFMRSYLGGLTHLHHPGYIGHQVAVSHFASALADFINGCTNTSASLYEMSPPGAIVESCVLEWMLNKIGWSKERGAGGVLTGGGALANLTALAAARAAIAPDAWDDGCPRDLVVLAPAPSHYSISRAAALLGLGSKALWQLPVDGVDRMDVRALPECHARARAAGKRVMAVVVNCCATGTGLYDPLAEAADYCRAQGLWLHVDACHGASALLSPRERGRLAGIDRADSVVWDAHKMLRVSNLCAAVLVRERKRLDATFQQSATYLIRAESSIGINQVKRSIECTKGGLGLKVLLTLAFLGEQGLAESVEDLYSRARRFHAVIARRPGFSCPYVPEANILCFRYGGDDETQTRVREKLLAEGDFYITSAEVAGKRYLRLTVMNHATTEQHIEKLLDRIVAIAAK